MSETYLGEIRMFAFDRTPVGWLPCDGSLYAISQYEMLFNLIGTTYGGDGNMTFAVPDFRGRVPVHQGRGHQLSTYVLGQMLGTESVVLTPSQMPQHTHAFRAATSGTRTAAAGGNLLGSGEADFFNRDGDHATSLSPAQIASSGNFAPHENMQPSLCVAFCIAASGIYPSRD